MAVVVVVGAFVVVIVVVVEFGMIVATFAAVVMVVVVGVVAAVVNVWVGNCVGSATAVVELSPWVLCGTIGGGGSLGGLSLFVLLPWGVSLFMVV